MIIKSIICIQVYSGCNEQLNNKKEKYKKINKRKIKKEEKTFSFWLGHSGLERWVLSCVLGRNFSKRGNLSNGL